MRFNGYKHSPSDDIRRDRAGARVSGQRTELFPLWRRCPRLSGNRKRMEAREEGGKVREAGGKAQETASNASDNSEQGRLMGRGPRVLIRHGDGIDNHLIYRYLSSRDV